MAHTMYREETRWPGYYYRGDFPKLDEKNGIVSLCLNMMKRPVNFMEKAPMYHMWTSTKAAE